jgi:hypothetical protein
MDLSEERAEAGHRFENYGKLRFVAKIVRVFQNTSGNILDSDTGL